MHETNTFNRVKTDMAWIRRRDFHLENGILQAFRALAPPAIRGIAMEPLRFNPSRAGARNIYPSLRPRQVRALRGYSAA
jgi:hypothetical protein